MIRTAPNQRGPRALTALGVTLLLAGGAVVGSAAMADWALIPDTQGRLELYWSDDSSPLEIEDYEYGDRVYWHFRAALTQASAAHFSVEVTATGDLATADGGLHVALISCAEPFGGTVAAPSCATGLQQVIPWSPVVDVATNFDGSRFELPMLTVASDRYFIVELGSSETIDNEPGLSGTSSTLSVGLHARALDTLPEDLSVTGADLSHTALLGGAVTGLGLVTLLLAAWWRRRRDTELVVGNEAMAEWLVDATGSDPRSGASS